MKTILGCLALGALLFAGSVGCVRARLQAPAPAAASTPPAAPEAVEDEAPPVEAAVVSRIDLRRWKPEEKYFRYSRAMPPQRRPPKPAPSRID
jgi:hypothetical protein